MGKIIGVNVRADGVHTPARVADRGANGVRIELFQQYNLAGLLRDYRRWGIAVLGVYTNQSQWNGMSHGDSMDQYMIRYGPLLDFIELGNEPDLKSDSSWTMDRRAFVRFGWECHNAVRAHRPDLPIIAGGVASGDTNYVRYLDLNWCNLLGFHPYAKDMTRNNDLPDIDVLVGQYREVTDKPFAITEYGWWGDEGSGESEVEDVVSWAAMSSDVEHYWHFCLSDDMVAPFGLERDDGSVKPAGEGFKRATQWRKPNMHAWDGYVGEGLLQAMGQDGVTPSWDNSRWESYGEICRAGDRLYVWLNDTQQVYRIPTEAP